ncbi:cytochrome c [Flavobacterium sp. 7E]|uniref:c-type cytochrome n=1 Tax=unclassified Flavobacterium TaxID=196869 RepID=UPI00156E362A|nr:MULTISPECIES: c-type cytochrome [unclassified Flavobacterium]NRS87984.1 cytochrome c [Flavobacterium sp. 7E]NRT14543.1 cytochrome c [Flavobacterium sp. 28A]
MKKLIFIGIVFLAFACKKQETESFGKQEPAANTEASSEGMQAEVQTPEKLGETIFNGKGTCATCHKVDSKLIGPSVQEIASVYKAKGGNIIAFLKDDAKPLVDPTQYEVMKANFAITKAMSAEELQGLEAYIYSNLK